MKNRTSISAEALGDAHAHKVDGGEDNETQDHVRDVDTAEQPVDGEVRRLDTQQDSQRQQGENVEQRSVLPAEGTGHAGQRYQAAHGQRGPLK